MALPKLQSAKQIGGLIDGLGKTIAAKDDTIHNVALQCLMHAKEHNDFTLLQRMVGGFTEKTNKETKKNERVSDHPGILRGDTRGVKMWAARFSPIRWSGDGKIGILKADSKTFTPFDIEGAAANPFYTLDEVKADNQRNPFDTLSIFKMVTGLPDRVAKAKEANAIPGDPKVVELYAGQLADFAKKLAEDMGLSESKAQAERVLWKGEHVSDADKARETVSGTINTPDATDEQKEQEAA